MGVTDEEITRPLIGIANSANELVPGHIHLDRIVEAIKAGRERLRPWLQERGYKVIEAGLNLLAIHTADETLNDLKTSESQPQSSAA